MKYRLTLPADSDLVEIWTYIAQDNPPAADRIVNLLRQKFSLIASHPQIGRACEELEPGLRRFPAGKYLIFYRVGSNRDEIVRILHGARDIESMFHPEEES